jgi:NAD(P)-dependent dehydrogenase (short-subunit alcohol dehydrogenase family)
MTGNLGLITGAAGGIGKACAERFAAEGWSLVLVDIDQRIKEVARSIATKQGQSIVGVAADVTNEEGIEAAGAVVKKSAAPLRFMGLVAGVNQPASAIETMDIAEWDRVMNINLRANFLMMRQFIPALKATRNASIVTVTSYWGRSAHAYFSAYCASKAAFISLTQAAAAELAPHVRVNSVAPGNVGTRMHFAALEAEAEKRGISVDDMRKIEWDKIPLGRPADPAEIAAAAYFLASDQGSYLTGATLDVNGGCGFY